MPLITPRRLKGFRDSLPQEESLREFFIETIKQSYHLFGFAGIDTPALEYTEILLGKGSGETDKQLYRFNDNGDRDVAMRFDLTVPLARFVAEHESEITFPFKRYHIAKVWRGENSQKGRFREFYQCDFDTIGTQGIASEFESLTLVADIFDRLKLDDYQIEINHRALLGELLEKLNISQEINTELLRLIDKSEKIGEESFESELKKLVSDKKQRDILQTTLKGTTAEESGWEAFQRFAKHLSPQSKTVAFMNRLFEGFKGSDIEGRIRFNPRITRGLDYYTGLVFETFLLNSREFGSVCSGGRYDDLAQLYTKKELPGIGGSVGLDRLLAILQERGSHHSPSLADLILFYPHQDFNPLSAELSQAVSELRGEGIRTLLYPEFKKLANQFKYAESYSIPYGLLAESSGEWTLKDLNSRESERFKTLTEAVKKIRSQFNKRV